MFLPKDFVKMYLHPEQIIAISCTEADEADNEVKYTGQCDKLPEEYGNIPVEYIKINGHPCDSNTLRIECPYFEDSRWDKIIPLIPKDVIEVFANYRMSLDGFVNNFLHDGQYIEVFDTSVDKDGQCVYAGRFDSIPPELSERMVQSISGANHVVSAYI